MAQNGHKAKKAVHQHEKNMHPGKPLTKLKLNGNSNGHGQNNKKAAKS